MQTWINECALMSSNSRKMPSCVATSSDESETESVEETGSPTFVLSDLVQTLPDDSNDIAVPSEPTVEDELRTFRHQWITELDNKNKENSTIDHNCPTSTADLSDRNLYSKKPTQCCKQLSFQECLPKSIFGCTKKRTDAPGEVLCKNLVNSLRRKIMHRGRFFELENKDVGFPTIVDMPVELLSVIVRYVVGSELDVISLETLTLVSSGFYLLARDPEVWYLICKRIFGISSDKISHDVDWRQMFVTVPHLYFHGVYIGKCSYVRHGETSFQDQFYRPCHIVVYYRYLRFFADGSVIMLTSSDHPSQTVPYLKSKKTRYDGALLGRYEILEGDCIFLKFCRNYELPVQSRPTRGNRRKDSWVPHGIAKQELTVEFQFGNSKKRSSHCILQWNKYDCQITYFNGETSSTSFDIMDKRYFPSLVFSRVKSYAEPDGWSDILD